MRTCMLGLTSADSEQVRTIPINLPITSTNSSLFHRRPPIHRASHEQRSHIRADAQLPTRPQDDRPQPRPPPPPRLPLIPPPNRNIRHNPRPAHPLHRRPLHPTWWTPIGLRAHHQTGRQPELARRRRRLEQRRRRQQPSRLLRPIGRLHARRGQDAIGARQSRGPSVGGVEGYQKTREDGRVLEEQTRLAAILPEKSYRDEEG